jgi:hypothetical protein
VLALLLAAPGAIANAAADSPQEDNTAGAQQTYEGMVSCSRCGAKHSAQINQTATVCARMCVRSGASFALVGPDSTYLLDGDIDALKQLSGHRVRVVGARTGNTIKISSIAGES